MAVSSFAGVAVAAPKHVSSRRASRYAMGF